MHWAKADATQCFGLSEPEKNCSRSTSGEHHCLVGEEWDALRERVGFLEVVNPTRTITLETGNWATYAVMSAIARILLEETMNFKVRMERRKRKAHPCILNTRVHLLSAFLRAKDPIDQRERSEFFPSNRRRHKATSVLYVRVVVS